VLAHALDEFREVLRSHRESSPAIESFLRTRLDEIIVTEPFGGAEIRDGESGYWTKNFAAPLALDQK
jgi:hypothetical protein